MSQERQANEPRLVDMEAQPVGFQCLNKQQCLWAFHFSYLDRVWRIWLLSWCSPLCIAARLCRYIIASPWEKAALRKASFIYHPPKIRYRNQYQLESKPVRYFHVLTAWFTCCHWLPMFAGTWLKQLVTSASQWLGRYSTSSYEIAFIPILLSLSQLDDIDPETQWCKNSAI